MRSIRSAAGEQGLLPLESLPDPVPREGGRGARRGQDGRGSPAGRAETSYLLGGELVRTRGWPPGTEVVLDPAARPERGDVLVVRERGRASAGVFEHRFGRAVLVSDRGVGWIGPQTEVLGVATLVGVTLEGMPHPL